VGLDEGLYRRIGPKGPSLLYKTQETSDRSLELDSERENSRIGEKHEGQVPDGD